MTMIETPPGGPMSRFFQMVGFEYDLIRSKAEALRGVNSAEGCPGSLLPLLASELGLQYESHLGMAQNRQLLGNLVKCYQTKGSVAGIENIVKALTGWKSTVTFGPNLVNTTHDEPRAFFTSTTIVKAGMGTTMVAQETSALAAQPTPGPTWPMAWYTAGNFGTPLSYAPWIEAYQSSAPISATLYFATAAGTNWTTGGTASYVDFSSALNPNTQIVDPVNYGTPVPASATVVSASILVSIIGTVPATFSFMLEFFDMHGNSLGLSTVDSHTYAPTGNFDQYKVQNITVPAGAVWMARHLHMLNTGTGNIVSAAGTGVILAAPMSNTGATVQTYVPPREILITLLPNRENIVPNPSFGNGATTGWTGVNCAIVVQNAVSYQDPNNLNVNTYALKVTQTGITGQSMSVVSGHMTIDDATRWWSASAYSRPAVTARNVSISMAFYDATPTLLGTIVGTSVAEVLATWERATVTTQSVTSPTAPLWTTALTSEYPHGATEAEVATVVATITWAACDISEIHYLAAIMVEKADTPGEYFDGDFYDALFSGTSDYQWAAGDTTKTGPSYYYRNFAAKFKRLDQVLSGSSPSAGLVTYGQNPNLTIPAAPVVASATAWNGQVTVIWAPSVNDGGSPILGYNIFMGVGAGAESAVPINGPQLVSFSPYTITDLANATEYYFVVRAVTAAGSSPKSNEVNATPGSGDGLPATHIGPGVLLTVWEIPGEYNTIGVPSSGLVQYSGQRFGSGNGPIGIVWVRSTQIPSGVVVNA